MKAYYETMLYHHKTLHTGDVTDFYKHFHAALEMVITLSGSQVFSVGEESMELPEGGVGIAFPFQEHCYNVTDKNLHGKKLAFIVPVELLDTPEHQYYSRFLPVTPFYIYSGNELNKLKSLIYPFMSDLEENDYPPHIDIDDHIWYRELIRSVILFHLEHTGVTEYDARLSDRRLLQNVMIYLEKHYEDCDFSVKNTAETLGVSYKYLSNMVGQSTGFTLIEHLHNLRISKARRMLATTSGSVTDIAFESGFSSLRTFNRVFMKYTGKTPSDYRVTKGDDNL